VRLNSKILRNLYDLRPIEIHIISALKPVQNYISYISALLFKHEVKNISENIRPGVQIIITKWLLFRQKNLDYFQEKKDKVSDIEVGLEPTHSHSQGGGVTHRFIIAPNTIL